MKKLTIGAMLFLSASLITLNSCKKTETLTPVTVLTSIQNDASLTIFSAIETQSGDNAVINSSTAIVIPVDSAFISAGILLSTVPSLSVATCDSIVKYYSTSVSFNLSSAPNTEMPFTSNLGLPLYADSSSTATYFNGVATISQTPVIFGSTNIYKLNQYINLPSQSISQIVANDPNLTLFNEALTRTNFATTLANGSYTLFVPNNTAFNNAGYPDIASIDAADINTLTKIIQYQTISNDLFDNDLMQQVSITSILGEPINITNTNGNLQLIGASDPGNPANLLTNGQLENNVFVYKTNNVLLP